MEQTEGLDFREASSSWPSATASSSSSRTRTRRPRRAGAGASGCWRCSTAPRASTPPTCGTRPRRRGRASIWPGAGCRRRSCASFRVGYAPERLGPDAARRAPGRVHRGGADGGGAGAARARRRALRPLPRAHHVPAGRRAGARARLRRARRWARGAARSTSTPARTRSTTRVASCSGSTGPRARPPRAVGSWSSRVTPTCLPFTRPASAEAVAIMGTALTPEQLAELGRAALAGRAGPRRRPFGPGGDAARGAPRRGARTRAARGGDAGRHRPGRARHRTARGGGVPGADGARGWDDRVSGAPGTCRC